MELLRFRPPAAKPGLGSYIDWSHPSAPGLAFASVFNDWNSATLMNLCAPANLGVRSGSSAPTWAEKDFDSGLLFPGGLNTAGYVSFGTDSNTRDLGVNEACTIFARFYWNGGFSGIAARNDNNSINAGWQMEVGGFIWEYSAQNYRWGFPSPQSNRWTSQAVVSNFGNNDQANTFSYSDGNSVAQTFTGVGTGTRGTDAPQTLYVGRSNFNLGASFDGYIAALYMWRRALGPGEIRALHIDPYALVHDTGRSFMYPAFGATGRRARSRTFFGPLFT